MGGQARSQIKNETMTMIVICGPNHSGTSFVAEALLNNGFTTGEYSTKTSELLPYIKYEDETFKQLCIKMNKGQLPSLSYLRNKGPFFFVKYPSAVLHLNTIAGVLNGDLKVVFCFRDFEENVRSFMEKTGHNKAYSENINVIAFIIEPFPLSCFSLLPNAFESYSSL